MSVSVMAVLCASVYAAPFENNRKVEVVALGRLYLAWVQNSRKWNSDKAERKNGGRHSLVSFCVANDTAARLETPSVMPSRNARVLIPD